MNTLSLQQLVSQTQQALVANGASDYFLQYFATVSRKLLRYAEQKKISSFTMDFGLQFLEDCYSMSQKIQEKKWHPIYLRCINALSDFQQNGNVNLFLTMETRKYLFPEDYKPSADKYLDYRKSIGIIPKSIQISSLHLERFFAFLSSKGIHSLDELSINDVYEFMDALSCYGKPTANHTMRTVRYYLKFCFEDGSLQTEMFSKLPNLHYNRQSRLPSVYSSEEVQTLLDSIDLGNPCGIRDYAIILLIARLGLRSSDVANLRFSNIDWEKERIRLVQVKTENQLELPLLDDVGQALINYLQNGRPQTECDHVFVKNSSPYKEFRPGCVGSLVRRHLQRTRIHLEGRKCGSHILRHSLASRLLEHEVPLPVISGILGHVSTETTMVYLRVDIAELKKCALEVDS